MLTAMLMRSMYDSEIGPSWIGAGLAPGSWYVLPPMKYWYV